MSIMDMIKQKKNAIVANMSKVAETTEDGRIIQNGDDRYTTKQSYSEGESSIRGWGSPKDEISTDFDFKKRQFEVKDQNGNSETLTIELRKVTFMGDRKVADSAVYFGNRNVDKESKKSLYNGKDLNNINEIRYNVRENPEFSHFLDKFFIVTPEERKSYKQYAKEQENIAEQKRIAERNAARAAENEKIRKENLKAQQDKIEKKQMRVDAALKQKIDEKFRGCK